MSAERPQFNQHVLIDMAPMPDHIPKVTEIGTSSAPLASAAFFIGARCRPYNDDYMKCKTDAYGRGELDCMKEGRKVTRCAASVLSDVNTHCLQQFRNHWQCLEHQNHQLWQCRKPERRLNACVYKNIGLTKTIPDTPEGEVPVHLRNAQIYATRSQEDPDPTRPRSKLIPTIKKMFLSDRRIPRFADLQKEKAEMTESSLSESSSAVE